MASTRELAYKYGRKFKPTLFDSGIGARLPDAYRKFFNEWKNTPSQAVNYTPYTGKTWVRDENTGEIKRFENVPLPEKIPKELNDVFTGGEAVIQGFVKKKKYTSRVARFWVPVVYRSVIYSEILDKHLSVLMTKRVVELIHEHEGFDNYLLQTKACDLKTLVALKVKQRLLLALDNRDLPYNEDKNDVIFKKYEKYLIPSDEIDWYGLTFKEACIKQNKIEEEQKKATIIPLKKIFRAQLIKELENLKEKKTDQPEGSEIKKSFQKALHINRFIKKS